MSRYISIFATFSILLWLPGLTDAAERTVDWTNTVNVTVSGDTLKKTGGCNGCEDAGAVSRQMIRTGDGFVEFTVGEANTFWLAGLSHADENTSFADIDFAFRFNGASQADVMENRVYQNGGDTPYRAGDVFRVAVVGGKVQYFKNGQLLLESRKVPEYPLLLDTALGGIGATIRDARIGFDARTLTRRDVFDEEDRFAILDDNGDGVISASEWRASRGTFNRTDLNRDGVVSRREFFDADTSVIGTSGHTILVDPTQRWTDTGLFIEAGDVVTFEAEGTIQMSSDRNDIARPAGALSGRRAADAPRREDPAGSLIARIGDSGPIFVGERRTITRAPISGRLFLGVNDDHLADNSGEYRVMVTIDRRRAG